MGADVRMTATWGHITLPPGGIGDCTISGGELTIGSTGERLWFGSGKLKDFEAWVVERLAEREPPPPKCEHEDNGSMFMAICKKCGAEM